jgi:hypothetical protein
VRKLRAYVRPFGRRQSLFDFAGLCDEQLRDFTWRSILQGDDFNRAGVQGQGDRQNCERDELGAETK